MSKHNQFLSKKYIDGMKSDFSQKLSSAGKKRYKKNIKYQGTSPDGKVTLNASNIPSLNQTTEEIGTYFI